MLNHLPKLYLFFIVCIFLSACKKEDEPESMDDNPPETINDKLLYSANPNGHNQLYRLEDGVSTVVLSNPAYDYWWAKVSPDKSKFLVYRSPVNPSNNHDNYSNADLMLYNIDGSNEQLLISSGTYGWLAQGVCRWNAEGSKILMGAVQPIGAGNEWRLLTTNVDGSNPIILSDYWAIDPNFSIENDRIVFIGFPNNELTLDATDIELISGEYIADQDTLINMQQLTFNNTRDHDPSFSPDGESIVFSAGNEDYSNVDIKTYQTDGTGEVTVLDDEASNGGSMCWSVDGSQIYFHSLNLIAYPFRIKKVNVIETSTSGENVVVAPQNNYGVYHPEVY